MDAEEFKTMLLAEEVISSRETLAEMRCNDFPTIKAEERSKLHRDLFKTAYPNKKTKIVSFDQIERLLNG